MKKRLVTIVITIILGLSGCSDPKPVKNSKPVFNANNKHIIIFDNEYFLIPSQAAVASSRFKNNIHGWNRINILSSSGLKCKSGDILWAEPIEWKKMIMMDFTSRNQYRSRLKAEGKLDCAHPLSNKEYEFYRSKEIENQANRRAAIQSNIDANIAYMNASSANMNAYLSRKYPQKINVNVRGSINHNIRYGY